MNNKKNIFQYKAAVWDIYGTILCSDKRKVSKTKKDVFIYVITSLVKYYFGLRPDLKDLYLIKNLYYKKIADEKNFKKSQGIDYPEVIIEKIWKNIFKEVLKINVSVSKSKDFAYDFETRINPVKLAKNVDKYLLALKNNNIINGIISNSQFYTLIILNNELKKINPDYSVDFFFNKKYMLLSYKTIYSKPSVYLFKKMIDKFNSKDIFPEDIIYFGNKIEKDVIPANLVNIKSVLVSIEQDDYFSQDEIIKLRRKYNFIHLKNYNNFNSFNLQLSK